MKRALLAAAVVAVFPLPSPAEILKNSGSEWEFLLYRTLIQNAIDPANVDIDFHSTWYDPAALGYDGPAFTSGTGYFGYGVIDGATITTNIWNPDGSLTTFEPPSGQRYTAYFRTTVTPTEPVQYLTFTGIIDDGAIIYVNGVELTRINMDPLGVAPDAWDLLSAGGGDENNPVFAAGAVNLPAGVPATIAVSMHSTSPTSSDMGFDFAIESAVASVPDNDDFAAATELSGSFPITATGTNSNGVGNLGASQEPGEPVHAGDAGGGSVWWSWTPATSSRVSLSTDGSGFNTLLAVYTGSAVDALTPVSRYANLNVPASSAEEPFHRASRVEFDAVAGTTYYIAVDGAGGAAGNITLTLDAIFSFLDPVEELLPAGSSWEYLLLTNAANQPIDPETLDPDFDTTWHTAALYDGPVFSGPAPALLGYGVINADPIVTNIWGGLDHDADGIADNEPPTGLRYATYFRATFTPAAPVENLGFEGLIDDGAIIYIDGVEAARINVDAVKDPDNWMTFADGANHGPTGISNEEGPQVAFALEHPLPAGVEVEIAVSLRNPNGTSSDQGFDLRVYSVNTPPEPPVPAGFDVTVGLTDVPGEIELSWPNTPGALYRVEFSNELEFWFAIFVDIPADPTGTNTLIDFPGTDIGFYRVVQE